LALAQCTQGRARLRPRPSLLALLQTTRLLPAAPSRQRRSAAIHARLARFGPCFVRTAVHYFASRACVASA